MPIKRNVFDFTLTAAANVWFGLSQWLMFWAVTRFASIEEAGYFALVLAVITPLFILSGSGLRQYLTSVTTLTPTEEFGFLLTRLLLMLLTLLAIVLFVFFDGGSPLSPWVVCSLAAGKAGEGIADISMGLLQRRRLFVRNSAYILIRGALVMSLFVGLAATTSIEWACVGYAVGTWTCVLLFDWRYILLLTGARIPGWHLRIMAPIVLAAAPLGLALSLWTFTQLVPRWVLEHHSGASSVAQYSAVYQLIQVALVASVSLGQLITPRLNVALHARQSDEFYRLVGGSSILILSGACLATLVVWLSGVDILGWVYGDAYSLSLRDMMIMIAAGTIACIASIFGFAVTVTGARKSQLMLQVVVLLVCIVLNIALAELLGGVSAAIIAYLLLNVLLLGAMIVLLRRSLREVLRKA